MGKQIKYLHALGAFLAFIGVTVRLFESEYAVFKYMFAAGTFLLIVVHFIYHNGARDEPIRVQRQHRLMLFASLFMGVAAYLMFKDDERWVMLVLIYALISLFLAFRTDSGKKNDK